MFIFLNPNSAFNKLPDSQLSSFSPPTSSLLVFPSLPSLYLFSEGYVLLPSFGGEQRLWRRCRFAETVQRFGSANQRLVPVSPPVRTGERLPFSVRLDTNLRKSVCALVRGRWSVQGACGIRERATRRRNGRDGRALLDCRVGGGCNQRFNCVELGGPVM